MVLVLYLLEYSQVHVCHTNDAGCHHLYSTHVQQFSAAADISIDAGHKNLVARRCRGDIHRWQHGHTTQNKRARNTHDHTRQTTDKQHTRSRQTAHMYRSKRHTWSNYCCRMTPSLSDRTTQHTHTETISYSRPLPGAHSLIHTAIQPLTRSLTPLRPVRPVVRVGCPAYPNIPCLLFRLRLL